MWTALGEGEPSHGVTLGWEPVRCLPSAVGPIGEWVCDLKSGANGNRPTSGAVWDGWCNGQRKKGLNVPPSGARAMERTVYLRTRHVIARVL